MTNTGEEGGKREGGLRRGITAGRARLAATSQAHAPEQPSPHTALWEQGAELRPLFAAKVYAMFRWHSGSVWFDDLAVSLLKEGLCDYSKLALQEVAESSSDSKQR